MARSIAEMFADVDKLDKKSVAFLLKAIEENNLPGFDYLEYFLDCPDHVCTDDIGFAADHTRSDLHRL